MYRHPLASGKKASLYYPFVISTNGKEVKSPMDFRLTLRLTLTITQTKPKPISKGSQKC